MKKNTCTSDNCGNQPAVRISFHDGQTGHYCQTCTTIIQRNSACGVKSAKPMSGADLVAYRVYNMPTPRRQQEEW